MEIVETRLKTSVDYAFRQFRRELLPPEIRENRLVDWIFSFDDLERNQSDNNEIRGQNVRDFFSLISAQLVRSTLNSNVTFYFASLFYLGRQWQVSEQAAEVAEQALHPYNLEETVNRNIQAFQDSLRSLDVSRDEYRSLVSEAIVDILQFAHDNHRRKIRQAQQWWYLWQKEVSQLEETLDQYVQVYNRYGYDYRFDPKRVHDLEQRRGGSESDLVFRSLYSLMSFSFQSEALYQNLRQSGVSLKNIVGAEHLQTPALDANMLQLLSFSLFVGRDSDYELHRFLEHYEHILRTQEQVLNAQRYAPIIQQVEAKLLRYFERRNYFAKYGSLKCPPDGRLKELWNMCQLPDGSMFFYAKNWIESLEKELSYSYSELPFKTQLTTDDIESYARSADSTIKRLWVKESIGTPQTYVEFVQYLFEQKWVVLMATSATYPTREKKGIQKWNVESFENMTKGVVNLLNSRGYKLVAPSRERLKLLWEQLLKRSSTSHW